MTYTYKLARRIARLRNSVMLPFPLLLALACSAGEPVGLSTGDATNADPDAIAVAPRQVILEANQSVLFKAYADATPGSAEITSIEWTADGGSLSPDGSFASASTGVFRVAGKRRGNPHAKGDTATVVIVAPQPSLADVVISPATPTVGAGLRLQFGVVGKLSDGTEVQIGATWSTTTGTIDAGGLLTAGLTPGTFQVIAKAASSNVADTVAVNVLAVERLDISPTSSSLAASGQLQYASWATLSDGRNFPGAGVAFSTTGGSITSSGLYTAPTVGGNYTVTAKVVGGTAAANASVSVVGSGPTTSAPIGSHPNLPAGFTTVAQNGFAGSSVPNSSLGGQWTSVAWHPEYIVSQVTASNPLGMPYVTKTVWPAGLQSGEAPAKFVGWNHASDYTQNTRYRKIYVSMVVKIPSSDYENQNTGTKIWYLAHGNTTQQNADFLMLGGTYNGTSIQNAMRIVMYISPADEAVSPGSKPYEQNVNTNALFTCGEWHQVEVYMDQGTVGNSDGTLRVWVDGVKVTDYTQRVKFLDAAYSFTQGFYALEWAPVWGV